jgi:hypothetical protein
MEVCWRMVKREETRKRYRNYALWENYNRDLGKWITYSKTNVNVRIIDF